VVFGHDQMQIAIDAIHELVAEGGKPEWDWAPAPKNEPLIARVTELAQAELLSVYQIRDKSARSAKLKEVYAATTAKLTDDAIAAGETPADKATIGNVMFDIEAKIVRTQILNGERVLTAATRAPSVDRNPYRRAAAYARFGSVHARRNASAGDCNARYEGRRAKHRRARRRVSRTLHAPLQHASVRDRRNGVASVRRSAVKSVTAVWPSARWLLACRAPTNSATPFAWCRKSRNRTVLRRWHRSAAAVSR